MANVRTNTLKQYIADKGLRLSVRDKDVLSDIARVGIVDGKDAVKHCYEGKESGARRLDKLCEAGVLKCREVYQPSRGKFKAYEFANNDIARLYGGRRTQIGAKRNALHEVITSKLFYAEGRPKSFVVESQFTKEQKALFRAVGGNSGDAECMPDALYKSASGELVVVESDSGQYSQAQIKHKQAAWQGFQQVWGQPAKSASRVHDQRVYRFD